MVLKTKQTMAKVHHEHHEGCVRSNPEHILSDALAKAREGGLRRTRALEDVLDILVKACQPLTLGDIAGSEDLVSGADRATVYRLLLKLEERGIIRRLGLHDRAAYYTLLIPGEHHDYLICNDCGKIEALDVACPVDTLEKQIAQTSGFRHLYHELEFYGQCPDCSAAAPTKA